MINRHEEFDYASDLNEVSGQRLMVVTWLDQKQWAISLGSAVWDGEHLSLDRSPMSEPQLIVPPDRYKDVIRLSPRAQAVSRATYCVHVPANIIELKKRDDPNAQHALLWPETITMIPAIGHGIQRQLTSIEPSIDHRYLRYYPCSVLLNDGRHWDRVLLAEATSFLGSWGTWPGDRRGFEPFKVSDILSLTENRTRLPARVANMLYEAGETSMGVYSFTVQFSSGERLLCKTGNIVDFLALPTDVSADDIVGAVVNPDPAEVDGDGERPVGSAEFVTCLFNEKG